VFTEARKEEGEERREKSEKIKWNETRESEKEIGERGKSRLDV
jgi:hypothetical protein